MAEDYCLLLRRDLAPELPAPDWPAGIQLQPYQPHQAAAVHQLLMLGQEEAGGDMPALDTWRQQLEQDAEYDPALCFVAVDTQGPVAVAQCWTSAYLKDLVVHPRARRQGLGRALLQHVFQVFQQRREGWVDLKVREDNQPARHLYASAGMRLVRREPIPR